MPNKRGHGIDDEIDAHLAEAGLAPRPRGFRWFLEVPPDVPDAAAFWRHINARFADLTGAAPEPAETSTVLSAIVDDMYDGVDD